MSQANEETQMISMSGKKEEMHAMGTLPEHLVENIVAQIPFPSILKARLLSKEWKFKFSSVVRQSFLSWPQYLSYWRKSEVVGYDSVLDSVKRMPVCNAKGKSLLMSVFACGPLVVALVPNGDAKSLEGTVNNVLTRKSRKISYSFRHKVVVSEPILVPVGTEHYELMICSFLHDGSTTFALYNSESCNWVEKSYITGNIVDEAAYMDGTLYYIIEGDPQEEEPLSFVRFDFQSGDQTITPIHVDGEATIQFTVRCGSDIMTVIADSRYLIVSQLDIESSALVEVARRPISEEDSYSFYEGINRFGASRNRIYFTSSSFKDNESPLLFIYEVDSKTWSRSYVPQEFSGGRVWHPPFVLDLGWNPFVEP